MMTTKNPDSEEVFATIETNYGKIRVKLYNDTPFHRDNFVKAIKAGAYDGVLFHRAIKDFMIQGGDPSTIKDAARSKQLDADFDYRVPAEIVYPGHFHAKGVLAAARQGDEVNPERASSSTQFYIVTGKPFKVDVLGKLEKQKFERLKQSIFTRLQGEHKAKIKELYKLGDRAALDELRDALVTVCEHEANELIHTVLFTDEQKTAYSTIGGAPHLDGEYTVFGEVVEGIQVVDKIQEVPTGAQDKPVPEIRMTVTLD